MYIIRFISTFCELFFLMLLLLIVIGVFFYNFIENELSLNVI